MLMAITGLISPEWAFIWGYFLRNGSPAMDFQSGNELADEPF
jgi:hypothetical protein